MENIMEILDCPRCLKSPEIVDGEPIYCCGIMAGEARLWNNYVHAMRIALTHSYSKYTKTPVSNEEVDEEWRGFDETYREKANA